MFYSAQIMQIFIKRNWK